MRLHQPHLYFNNVEKINLQRLSPNNNANNLDAGGQPITFHKGRTNDFVRLSESYLEITFSYTTQTTAVPPVITDNLDITFENDFVSKLFNYVELKLGGYPIETISTSNYATELAGYVLYSSDEDKQSGYSFGWIPDYGAGTPELSLSGLVGALSLITATPPTAGNNTAINALTLSGTAPGGNIPAVNQSGYFKRKIFYNKPQSSLSGMAAGSPRTCTLCVPLWHFFQSITSYDKIICNLDIDLTLIRDSTGSGRWAYSQVAGTNIGLITNSINWCFHIID